MHFQINLNTADGELPWCSVIWCCHPHIQHGVPTIDVVRNRFLAWNQSVCGVNELPIIENFHSVWVSVRVVPNVNPSCVSFEVNGVGFYNNLTSWFLDDTTTNCAKHWNWWPGWKVSGWIGWSPSVGASVGALVGAADGDSVILGV